MSELRHRFDRAAVSGRITQPPFAELADRGRRRAHRNRTVRLTGVAMFAALVAAPMLTLPNGDQPLPPMATAPPTFEASWEWHDIHVSFLDLDHGAATYKGDDCGEGWVSVTEDGGKTWSELHKLPKVPDSGVGAEAYDEPPCLWPYVTPISPDMLLIPGPPPPSVQPERPSFISHDAGRTWQEHEPQVRVADSVPDGVIPYWPCDEDECVEQGLGWYDPETGDWMVLRNNPPGMAYHSLTVSLDGTIWAYGGRSGEFQLSVSRDRGRSWLDRSPDGEDVGWLAHATITAHDGDTVYLHPAMSTEEPDPFDLYRTTDGGETWHPMPAAQQFEDVLGVWTTRAGGLVVSELTGELHLSTDGGETFARTELPVRLTFGIPGGLQGWPVDRSAADAGDVYLSDDGESWRPVKVPYYPDRYADWQDAPATPPSPDR